MVSFLRSCLAELFGAHDLDHYPWFIPRDPRLVAGRNGVGLAGASNQFGAIIELDGEVVRYGGPETGESTRVCAYDRLDALRPAPTRFKSESANREALT
jgi:hypothetical protein